MAKDIVRRTQLAAGSGQRQAVTNIGQLMEALAVGWVAGSYDNRRVMAGDYGQFVRVDPRRYLHPFYKAWPGDIAIDSGSYRMAGFVRLEAPTVFRGLFKTDRAGDGVWHSAELTQHGYDLAIAGVLDDFKGLTNHPFFAPDLSDIQTASAINLSDSPRLAATSPPTKEST